MINLAWAYNFNFILRFIIINLTLNLDEICWKIVSIKNIYKCNVDDSYLHKIILECSFSVDQALHKWIMDTLRKRLII